MSEGTILEWSKKNIEFGGHTSHHVNLREVADQRVDQEIAQCKDELTALLGKPPASFAYPFGGVSPGAYAAARKNFELAFTTMHGILNLATDPHLVPRISFLPGETRFGMWCRLRLGKNPYEVCRNRWTRLFRNNQIHFTYSSPLSDSIKSKVVSRIFRTFDFVGMWKAVRLKLIARCRIWIRAMLSCDGDDFGQAVHLQVSFGSPLGSRDMP